MEQDTNLKHSPQTGHAKEGYYMIDENSKRWKNAESPTFIQINEEK
jgi:hypothetical protein